MALIEINSVTKAYGEGELVTQILHGVSFSIAEGEFVSIMGPSGSGKSTLLHILGLLDRPSTGTYMFADKNTADLPDEELARLRNEHMGFVFQAFHLLARTSVLENVMLPLYYSSIPKKEYVPRAKQALAHVNMSHREQHLPSQLSGGEKQRVAIARALVNDPKVIFADEPTGNLDSKTGQQVMNTIDALHKTGKTIIVITHETTAAAFAQRIIQIGDGLIVSDQKTESTHNHYHK
jgi:putative ABC transport system ATP-binding protein